MKELLIKAGYSFDSDINVWTRADYTGIAYSNGDLVEQRIANIINEASDLSVLSAELRQHCTDWPSLYHLSSARANILRPFESIIQGDILEIGAGCGAITRYLGECRGNVLALEGSPRRAAIARSRTRDLQNVTVVAENFERFRYEQLFDVITMIGVLEYANLFINHDEPALGMLSRVKSLLKPDGVLILAIENQLGLKYFAGAPEDHIGQPMYGVEGRYRKNQPQTYGRKVLTKMLEQAGFTHLEFMAPFPDYKLPISIITEKGFSFEGFDASALAWQSVKRDPQLPQILSFSPELVWPSLIKNTIGLDFSNSFLVLVRGSKNQTAESAHLAWHFTSARHKIFCKRTEFLQTPYKTIELRYYPLIPGSSTYIQSNQLTFSIPEKAPYVQGRLLSQELTHIVTRDGWQLKELADFFEKYFTFLISYASDKGNSLQINSPESLLPGDYFDLIPQNIIIDRAGTWHVIDKEWRLNTHMTVGRLLFRSLLQLLYSITRFGACADEDINTPIRFIEAAFKTIGFNVSEERILNYAFSETSIQEEVSGQKLGVNDFFEWLRNATLQRINLHQAVAERDAQITSLNQAVAQLEAHLNRILSSRSWFLTKPFRFVARLLRGELVSLRKLLHGFKKTTNNNFRNKPASENKLNNNEDISKNNGHGIDSSAHSRHILLVSYYCPSRAHAGGLRILDIYSLIKSNFPNTHLDLYTYKRPEIDWTYEGLENIFDNILFSRSDKLSVEEFNQLRNSFEKYNIVDLQFHGAARQIKAWRKIGKKIIFTPMESLIRNMFVRIRREGLLPIRKTFGYLVNARQELIFAEKADEVVCVSKNDASSIRMFCYTSKVHALETCISNIEFSDAFENISKNIISPEQKRPIILYIAYFGSDTNVQALRWYLDKVHRLILEAVSDYQLHVIGRGDMSPFKEYESPSIEFIGAVPKLSPYFKQTKVGIAPALNGSGFRGKVNQYAIYGVPVVASAIAAKGLMYKDGRDIFIADKYQEFASKCVKLLTDNNLNAQIGKAAMDLVFKYYTWESKINDIKQIYNL